MEVIRGHKIRDILLHNHNWWLFYCQFSSLIRQDIIINIIKILACGTAFLGYQLYQCGECGSIKTLFHTCKSRFCTSCGKKATDNWINKHLEILPQTTWQHVTFTFPQELQPYFWLNRHLINNIFPIPANLITRCAAKMGIIPGIFISMHTFGRDLKRNLHFHLSTTLCGLSRDKTKWMKSFRFNRNSLAIIKQQWRESIITLLRQQHAAGNLVLPDNMTDNAFNDFLIQQASKQWVVHFAKSSDNHHRNVNYLGRYLKRPPIGETRIKDYDGENVTYTYFDHHDKTQHNMTMPVFDFIKRLIAHVPDRYFRIVRYYNWLSTRTRNQYLPFVYNALKQIVKKVAQIAWRKLYRKTFGKDPLTCPCCQKEILTLQSCTYTHNIGQLKNRHQDIADPASYCHP